ncbi:MAG: UbiA family prenyltransferase [Streptosporangiaceae bacterium]
MTAGALRGLARACHPEPTVAVTAVVTALAVSAGRGSGAVWVGLAVLAGQLSIGWSNDYVDRERDRRAGRVDKPLLRGDIHPAAVAIACAYALVAAVALSFASGWRAALAHLAGVAAAWAYNFGVKTTAWSPLPYAVAFGLLPAFVTLGLPNHPWPAWWVLAAGALIGVGAHFANVLPDIDSDLVLGVRGLPQRLGAARSRLGSAALLTAASVLLAAGPGIDPLGAAGAGVAVILLGAGVAARRLGRTPFLVTIAVAALDVVLLIARGGGIS